MDHSKIPVLLLKTKSATADSYEELFSKPQHGFEFAPIFVPVLQHTFEAQAVATLRSLMHNRKIARSGRFIKYGGIIFTSQRAVEVFALQVADLEDDGHPDGPWLQDLPLYCVGPATSQALKAIKRVRESQVRGEHTGNGQALAAFIQEDYVQTYRQWPVKPPLLFLVGEQRRDVIPKTLMDSKLETERYIHVDELVMYGTSAMGSFPADFARAMAEIETGPESPTPWVVVFSPTGCEEMLSGLGLLDAEAGRAKKEEQRAAPPRAFVATIGPTTREHLLHAFDFEPQVCAPKPSPGGVLVGITDFLKSRQAA